MLFDPRPKEKRSELYDRTEEIEKIVEYSRKYPFTILLGIRRVGKSSVLKVVMNEMQAAIYIDARRMHFESGGWITYESFVRNIEKEINALDSKIKRTLRDVLEKVEGVSFAGLNIKFRKDVNVSDVFDSLNEFGPTVIAVDEAQYFRFYGRQGGKEFLSLIAYAYDNLKNISFIFAGSEIGLLHDFLGADNYNSPLYGRVYGEVIITPFRREVARNFLEAGFREANIEVSEEEIEKAIDYLDGIPGWLVEFGYNYTITREFASTISKVMQKAQEFIAGELRELQKRSNRYSLILKAIAMGFNRWEKIREFIEYKDRNIPNSRLATLLKTLEKMSWIKEDNKIYTIVDPVVEKIIKEKFP